MSPFIRRSALPLLALAFLVVVPVSAHGQAVEDPVIPRGKLLFQASPSASFLNSILDPDHPDGRRPLGFGLNRPELSSNEIPWMEDVEARLSSLLGPGEAPRLVLGSMRGRISADEQIVPLRIGYGLLDRLTLGVTVPFVRRRVDSAVRLGPDGSNVGATPSGGDVTNFLNQAGAALSTASAQVEEECTAQGETSDACRDGRQLMSEVGAFLAALGDAYQNELIFPLAGSSVGASLSQRWATFQGGLAQYGGSAPENLVLAAGPLTQEQFQEFVLAPRWETGFPNESMEAFLELGDVELHAAFSLLRRDRDASGGMGIRSAVVGTVRFPTGQADTMRIVAPMDPPRGVSALGVRWVTDLHLGSRIGLLAVAEVESYGSQEVNFLAPFPARLLGGAPTREPLSWTPGTLVRVEATPRLMVGPALSIGAGAHYVRRGANRYAPLAGGNQVDFDSPASSLFRVSAELRYAALSGPVAELTPFPFELMIRYSQPFAGEGPDVRRIEAGVSVLRSRPSLR